MDRVLAIAGLRLRLMVRKTQGTGGTLNLVGAALLGVFGVALAFGAAVGFGLMVHVFAGSGDASKIRIGFLIIFYACLFLGVLLPLLRGALDQGFDASPFVLFPVSRRRLYGITLAASAGGTDHLLYYPTLVVITVTGVFLPGINPMVGIAFVLLLALFLVIWSNLLALFLVSVMRARRVREIAAVVGLLVLIGASFVPILFDEDAGDLKEHLPQLVGALETAKRVVSVLPPSIAAEGLTGLHRGAKGAWTGLLWLLLWNTAGLVLGYYVFDRYHLREQGVRVGQRRLGRVAAGPIGRALSFDGRLLAMLPHEVRAVAAKDFRYLLRSVVGRFVLFVTPLFAFLMVFLIGRAIDEPVLGIRPDRLLLFGLLLYTVLFSNNFLYNSFAWEGDGVKSYFLSPVRLRSVLLGKNVAVWLYNAILLALVLATWTVVMGPPGLMTLASGAFLYVAALLIFSSFGNFFSVRFPVARDMSTTRNQPAQISILMSILILLGTGLLLGPFVSLPVLLGLSALQPVLLAIVAGAMIGVYSLTLGYAARLLGERRDQLIEALRTVH